MSGAATDGRAKMCGSGAWRRTPLWGAAFLAMAIHAAFFFGFSLREPAPMEFSMLERSGVEIELEHLPKPARTVAEALPPPAPLPVISPPAVAPFPEAPQRAPLSRARAVPHDIPDAAPERVADVQALAQNPDQRASSVEPERPASVQVSSGQVSSGQASQPDRPAALRAVDNPPPVYPQLARRRGQEGRVIVRVVVDTSGHAASVVVEESSGHSLLDQAASTAVRGWLFEPARLGGVAVTGEALVPVIFSLR